jgi:hypothetical protein
MFGEERRWLACCRVSLEINWDHWAHGFEWAREPVVAGV